MKFLETRGLHIYSTPPALNVKYLNLTRGQLPTPQSATFNLGSKKPGSERKEREDAKISFFTVFCLEILSSFTALLFKHMKTNKTSSYPQQKVLQTLALHQGIRTCYYTSTKSIDLMVAWPTRMLEHQHCVWRHLSHSR